MRKEFEKYKTEYSLSKDWIFPFSEVEINTNIILYGAGDVGQAYYNQIQLTSYCNVIKWVDKKFDSYECLDMGLESPLSIVGCKYDYVVIAVYSASIAREINDELLNMGVEQDKIVWIGKERTTIKGTLVERRLIWPIQNRLKEVYRRRGVSLEDVESKKYISIIEDKIRKEDALILPRLVVELTTVCTLHCKGCNNLMPLYEKPKHISKEVVLKDIQTFFKAVDGVITVELIGGEPFAYPWLAEVLVEVLKYECIEEIEITTNGTILPSESLLELLKNNKVTVNISKYAEIDYKNDLSELLHLNGIRYEEHKELQWIDSGGTECRNRSSDEIKSIYLNCHPSTYCKTLFNGRIFACARSASLYDLGICTDESGYLDLSESDDLREEIKRFWLKDTDKSCNYCDFADNWRIISAGEQLR